MPLSHKISVWCAISPHPMLQISNELKISCQNNHDFFTFKCVFVCTMRITSLTLLINACKLQQRTERLCLLAAYLTPNTTARLMCALYFDYIMRHMKSGFSLTKLNHRGTICRDACDSASRWVMWSGGFRVFPKLTLIKMTSFFPRSKSLLYNYA